ncbi:prepilin-type N-terminal cleavage/methylation domain-containing protein [uncultured Clostridium sp.]|uniref:prepilin-type N-terminal cleavage/methylation domain-containing protein n=1 Tax=uncultured Clostridium sp. TaxID=59620 RepID=UPI00260E4101|nr:prepilin-type N-terminal cleavage/methylation domain-containing protein [uncultured Clostridium sp.]
MNLTKKKKKGFTLIELMAVIAIIAILAAVLVPTVTGYINRSKKTAIVSQVRNVITAVETHNATATGTEIIGTDKKVTDLVGTNGLIEEDLLTEDSINRLNEMTIGVAQEINQDSNAVKNITLKGDGTFESFNGKTEDGTPVTP